MSESTIVVGLTGPNAAGKGLAAEFFLKRGFAYHSLSDAVREEALRRCLTTSRQDLIAVGKSLREERGLSALAEMTFKKLSGRDVVDSFRHPAEVEYFRKNSPFFVLLGVDAPQELRFERARRRLRGGDSTSSFEEFVKREEEENGRGAGQQLKTTFALADEVVINAGEKTELESILEPFYNRLLEMLKTEGG